MPFLTTLLFNAIGTLAVSLGATFATATAIATAVVQFAVSTLINAAISAIFGKDQPTAQDISAKLSQPTTAPAYRFVYGDARATGTPVGIPVKGVNIWGAWILNSRPSDLSSFTLHLDKREVVLTGDAFDLSGAGATATTAPFLDHVTVWISRGNHTAPPTAFTTDAAYVDGVRDDLWKTSDAWQGQTMIWLKLDAGSSGERSNRWPSTPPLVEVEGQFSLVYDPREAAHDPADPATWEWSESHALCVRDALTQNPIRPYLEGQVHESFNADGPDACDETVALLSGGSEARYVCSGTIVWTDGEIEDQLNPMMISGAADFIRVGGKLGYAGGVYRAPTETLTYLLGDGFEFPDMVPGANLVNSLRVTYISSGRGFETAELLQWPIPNALAADGGIPAVKTMSLPFCPSATQAMRVRKIAGLRLRRQERINGGTLPPEAFNLVGGATATIALPSPYDALNGVYEIESIHPGLDPIGESGEVAMRLPAALVKHDASIYAWVPSTDEEVVFNEPYNDTRSTTADPGALSVTTGDAVNLNTGSTIIPRIRFAFDPSPSSVTTYEWEFRETSGDYESGGYIDGEVRDGSGDVFAFMTGTPGQTYEIRVRAIGTNGNSDFVEITGVTPVVDITIDVPNSGTATGGVDEIVVTFRTPNDADFRSIEIHGSDTDSAGSASLLGSAIFASQNTTVSITETGLGTSKTRFYFARSRGDFASASAFTASVTASTDA